MGRCVLREWVVRGGGLDEYFGVRDSQWASRRVLMDFTEDALTISADSLFQNGTARIVRAKWRRRVHHRCWWNLKAWLRTVFDNNNVPPN